MDTKEGHFARLMERLREGDSEAARELFERYGEAILLVVRHRLSRRLRAQFDSRDFTQDAWMSFFHLPSERYTFESPDELLAFLSRIARRKVIDASRHRLGTVKRNRHRVQALQCPLKEDGAGNEPPARQPTPSQFAIADEQWDRLLHDQPPSVRLTLEMLRQGHSQREVADALGVPTKTIQRVLQNLKRRAP